MFFDIGTFKNILEIDKGIREVWRFPKPSDASPRLLFYRQHAYGAIYG